MKSAHQIALIACSSLALCSSASAAMIPKESVRFSERIAPLAAERCDGCHLKAPTGPMAVYSNAKAFITPGKPDESRYYALPKGHPASWGDAAALVRAWIVAGAPE